jgi:hypothetical protein
VYAVDLNPDAAEFLPAGWIFSRTSAHRLDFFPTIPLTWLSQAILGYLPTKSTLDAVLKEVQRVLRPRASIYRIAAHIRYAYREYWINEDKRCGLANRFTPRAHTSP